MLRYLNVSGAEQLLNALFSSSLISHWWLTQNFSRGLIFEDLFFFRFYPFRNDFSNVMPIMFVNYRDIYNLNQLKIYVSIISFYLAFFFVGGS